MGFLDKARAKAEELAKTAKPKAEEAKQKAGPLAEKMKAKAAEVGKSLKGSAENFRDGYKEGDKDGRHEREQRPAQPSAAAARHTPDCAAASARLLTSCPPLAAPLRRPGRTTRLASVFGPPRAMVGTPGYSGEVRHPCTTGDPPSQSRSRPWQPHGRPSEE